MHEVPLRQTSPKALLLIVLLPTVSIAVGYFSLGASFVHGLSNFEMGLLLIPILLMPVGIVLFMKDYYWDLSTQTLKLTYPFVPGLHQKRISLGRPRHIQVRENSSAESRGYLVLVECDKIVKIACGTKGEAEAFAKKLCELSSEVQSVSDSVDPSLNPIETKFRAQFEAKIHHYLLPLLFVAPFLYLTYQPTQDALYLIKLRDFLNPKPNYMAASISIFMALAGCGLIYWGGLRSVLAFAKEPVWQESLKNRFRIFHAGGWIAIFGIAMIIYSGSINRKAQQALSPEDIQYQTFYETLSMDRAQGVQTCTHLGLDLPDIYHLSCAGYLLKVSDGMSKSLCQQVIEISDQTLKTTLKYKNWALENKTCAYTCLEDFEKASQAAMQMNPPSEKLMGWMKSKQKCLFQTLF